MNKLTIDLLVNFINPTDFNNLVLINSNFQKIFTSQKISKKAFEYMDCQLKEIEISDIEDDNRDDCGTSGDIYYLTNGMVLSNYEYEYLKNDICQELASNMGYFYYKYIGKLTT